MSLYLLGSAQTVMASIDTLIELLGELIDEASRLAASMEDPARRIELESARMRLLAVIDSALSSNAASWNIADADLRFWRQRIEHVRQARRESVEAGGAVLVRVVSELVCFAERGVWAPAPIFVCAQGHVFSPPPPSTCDRDGSAVRRYE